MAPKCSVEVLIPDFKGDEDALKLVLEAGPDIMGHNLETVERLHPDVRPGGRYWRSISLLGVSKRLDPATLTKSGLMLGLGEQAPDLDAVLVDLRAHDVDILTLGQYLRPSMAQLPVERFVPPEEFDAWAVRGKELGFLSVASGPFVRSSYNAAEVYAAVGAESGAGGL